MTRFFSALSLFSLSACSLTASALLVGCGEPPPGTPEGSGGAMMASGGSTPGTGGNTPGTGGGTPGTGGGTPGTGGEANPDEPQSAQCGDPTRPFPIVADESTNMQLTSNLTLNPTTVAASNTGLTFDWSAVDTDFFGHPIDWNEIVMASLVVWAVDAPTIADLINTDSPDLMQYVVIPVQLPLDGTRKSAMLTEFVDAGGAHIPEETLLNDYLAPEKGYTFTLILQDEATVGVGARMIQAFNVEAGNPNTGITLTNDSTNLTASATFGQPIQVPLADPNITIDWSETIATRSYGGEFDPTEITEVLVGQYDPTLDLEAGILDLETAYKNLYTGEVEFLEPFDLSTLTNEADQPFPGIDGTDQWYVGLLCADCSNPSPWFLTQLTPCP